MSLHNVIRFNGFLSAVRCCLNIGLVFTAICVSNVFMDNAISEHVVVITAKSFWQIKTLNYPSVTLYIFGGCFFYFRLFFCSSLWYFSPTVIFLIQEFIRLEKLINSHLIELRVFVVAETQYWWWRTTKTLRLIARKNHRVTRYSVHRRGPPKKGKIN